MVSGQSFGSSAVSLACITSICPVQRFSGGHSLRLAFGSFFYPIPPPLYSTTDDQCDGCLVPLAWGLMAGGRGFASHGGVTLSRDWLCHRWKPLEIPPASTSDSVVNLWYQRLQSAHFLLSDDSTTTLHHEAGPPEQLPTDALL